MENIKQICWESFLLLLPAILGVISGFAIWLANKGVEIAKTHIAKINNEVAQNKINEAMQTIRSVTNDVVTSIEQTIVSEIRKAIADGTKDKDDLKALADEALVRIKEIVGKQILSLLEVAQINADKYIADLIETDVYYLKRMNAYRTQETIQITDEISETAEGT